ncbi:MAG: AtpZ/AtpI family protein [Candidatus Kapaibacterium sp.]
MAGGRDKDDKEKKKAEAYREIGRYSSLGLEMIIPIFLGFFLGKWIDGKADSHPLWTLVLGFMGIITGMVNFFKTVLKKGNKRKKNT